MKYIASYEYCVGFGFGQTFTYVKKSLYEKDEKILSGDNYLLITEEKTSVESEWVKMEEKTLRYNEAYKILKDHNLDTSLIKEEKNNLSVNSMKYDRDNTKRVYLKFNINTDKDILNHLDLKQNVQGYIKELIRKDIKE